MASTGICENGYPRVPQNVVAKQDQYADGKAANLWEVFIGDRSARTENYRNVLVKLLREHECKRILDIACGTGVDSMLLIEEGFDVVSVDGSDKMLKHALRARWERRKDPKYDRWVIEEANWLTLHADCRRLAMLEGDEGFDAVICLGNSFAHMLDERGQRRSLANAARCLRPGGLLLIDHRNYDYITAAGSAPTKCIYYDGSNTVDIKTSILMVNGEPRLVIRDYQLDTSSLATKYDDDDNHDQNPAKNNVSEFRLSYYPHKLDRFIALLRETFGKASKLTTFGDFQPLGCVENPSFYIHVVEKYLE